MKKSRQSNGNNLVKKTASKKTSHRRKLPKGVKLKYTETRSNLSEKSPQVLPATQPVRGISARSERRQRNKLPVLATAQIDYAAVVGELSGASKRILGKPHFWMNCRVREDYHQHQAAAYILVHDATGRFFVDATASLYSHMQFQEASLKGGVHFNNEVQRLYNLSPKFHLYYELVGGDDPNGLNRLEAEELKQMWLAAFATDPNLINSRFDAIGYQAMGMARPLLVQGQQYPNVKTAARALGIAEKTVTRRCNNSKKPDWRWL